MNQPQPLPTNQEPPSPPIQTPTRKWGEGALAAAWRLGFKEIAQALKAFPNSLPIHEEPGAPNNLTSQAISQQAGYTQPVRVVGTAASSTSYPQAPLAPHTPSISIPEPARGPYLADEQLRQMQGSPQTPVGKQEITPPEQVNPQVTPSPAQAPVPTENYGENKIPGDVSATTDTPAPASYVADEHLQQMQGHSQQPSEHQQLTPAATDSMVDQQLEQAQQMQPEKEEMSQHKSISH